MNGKGYNGSGIKLFSRFFAASFILVAMAGYFFYQAHDLIVGPDLQITSPRDGEVVYGQNVYIEGEADPGSDLTVNGAKMYSDSSGHFSQELLLARGLHVLEVIAKDRFGKEKKVVRQIVVK